MSERFGATGHDYTRTDDGTSYIDEAKVNELLAARLHARLNRDFVAADRMRDQLRREHNVEVADQDRQWRVVVAEPAAGERGEQDAGGSGAMDRDDDRYDDRRRRRDDDDDDDDDRDGGQLLGHANGEALEGS